VREPDGFREFLAARQTTLIRAGWLLTGDVQHAEDLVQTALVKIMPHWNRLYAAGEVEPYLRRIMATTYTSWRRRRWNAEVPADAIPEHGNASRSDPNDEVGVRDELFTALRSLPRGQRAVVVLRFYFDLSESDTAAALGCGTGTVKSQSSKALATLRRLLPSTDRSLTDTSLKEC
jgi:RNA polymerase sigma-70 factor (sigma-E family)